MLKHKYSPITEHCQKYWTKTKTKIDNKNFIKIFSDMDQVEPCYTTNLKSPDSLRQQIDGSTDIEMAVTKVKTEQWTCDLKSPKNNDDVESSNIDNEL